MAVAFPEAPSKLLPFFLEVPNIAVSKIEKNIEGYKDILLSKEGFSQKKDCMKLSGEYYSDVAGFSNDLSNIIIKENCSSGLIEFTIQSHKKERKFSFKRNEVYLNENKDVILLQKDDVTVKGNLWRKKLQREGLINFFSYSSSSEVYGCSMLFNQSRKK
jgi:hypothetical protein